MHFIIGAVLLVGAIALLGAARFAVARLEETSLVRKYAMAEVTALAVTALSAFGIGFLVSGIASDRSGTALVELGAAIGLVLLAGLATIRLIRRPAKAKSTPLHRAPSGRRAGTA